MDFGIPPQLRRKTARRAVLDWYDAHARELPWRVGPNAGRRQDPYRVWLSEIMLQQTTVAFVMERFQRFMTKWPDVTALADASLDEVLTEWAGLGYYARARNLHACARKVAEAGAFPQSFEGLRTLPGVGDYTASAVAAIAFDAPVLPVDANIERVIARIEAIDIPLPKGKAAIRAAADAWRDGERPGDFAQALMDLGAAICRPKAPLCMLCPLRSVCRAYQAGDPERYPAKAPKAERPSRRGVVFWVTRGGETLLRRNPERGLLGGMVLPPSTPWREGAWSADEARLHAPFAADWAVLPGEVRHVFTHFALALEIWRAEAPADFAPGPEEIWTDVTRLDEVALPGVGRKIASMAIGGFRKTAR